MIGSMKSSFTKDDLAQEFRQLSASLQASLRAELKDVLRSEFSALHVDGDLSRSNVSHCLSGSTPQLHIPGGPGLESLSMPLTESQSGKLPTWSHHFVKKDQARKSSRPHVYDEPAIGPMFKTGYCAKKAFDEMAPVFAAASARNSLNSEHEHDQHDRQITSQSPASPHGLPPSLQDTATANDTTDTPKGRGASTFSDRGSTTSLSKTTSLSRASKAEPAWGVDEAGPKDLRKIAMMSGGTKPTLRKGTGTMQVDKKYGIRDVNLLAKWLLRSSAFDVFSGLAIVLYTFKIGIQTDWLARNPDDELPEAFNIIETGFCFVFTAELLLRAAADYRCFSHAEGWRWNLLDLVLVVLQYVDFVLQAAIGSGKLNMSYMRLLRALRVVRIARIAGVVRFLSEMKGLVHSIIGSMKSLLFVLILLGMLVYITGIFFMQLVTETIVADRDNAELRESLKDWSNLSMSCLVLFQCLTGGADWGQTLQPLMDHVSPLLGVVFTLYIAFGVLCMLNVVTGVFVDSATKSTAEEKDVNLVNRLQSFLCSHGQSVLTWDYFKERLEDEEIQLYLKSVDLDISEAHGLFQLLDTDDTGSVEAEEFVMGCLRLRGVAKAVDLASFMYESRRFNRQVWEMLRDMSDQVEGMVQVEDAPDIGMQLEPSAGAEAPMSERTGMESDCQLQSFAGSAFNT